MTFFQDRRGRSGEPDTARSRRGELKSDRPTGAVIWRRTLCKTGAFALGKKNLMTRRAVLFLHNICGRILTDRDHDRPGPAGFADHDGRRFDSRRAIQGNRVTFGLAALDSNGATLTAKARVGRGSTIRSCVRHPRNRLIGQRGSGDPDTDRMDAGAAHAAGGIAGAITFLRRRAS